MLVFELGQIMSVQQYVDLKGWMKEKGHDQAYIKLPDSRMVEWFDDGMIHTYLFGEEPVDQKEPEPKVHGPNFEEKKGE